jgi:hypothetical protein
MAATTDVQISPRFRLVGYPDDGVVRYAISTLRLAGMHAAADVMQDLRERCRRAEAALAQTASPRPRPDTSDPERHDA